jgi:GMP synthase (glutamine-hydrolysing)
MIIIVDFGSQTTHLIARRYRELSVNTKIIEPDDFFEVIKNLRFDGIIFSGGPTSVYDENAPTIDKKIFELGKPILGICYGEQLIAHLLDGEVVSGKKKEYGPATLTILKNSPLFDFSNDKKQENENNINQIAVWMNHGDELEKLPSGFEKIGETETIPYAAITNLSKNIYGVQFHPEVVHTQFGIKILKNFAEICNLSPKEKQIDLDFVKQQILDIKESIGEEKVIGAFSGGVDSSIACLMVYKALGKNFIPIYIDSGLMREGETEYLEKVFKDHYEMKVKIIDAKDRFLNNLKDVSDPETKRKIIGRTFIEILQEEADKIGSKFLVQGTIYPDVIESAGTKHAKNIKSHHNVGGLPKDMKIMLLEPLRNFYKDEVRSIGQILGLPSEITNRHPFPGPGLAIRIIGDVTDYKLDILRQADKIVQDVIAENGKADDFWQIFAIFTGIKTTGVRGDDRAYGETIAIRAVESKDVMSAGFAKLTWDILEKISVRIVTEIKSVNRVVYDITNKPPGTIEWE